MKCEKCGNEYPSFYYFATEKICKVCYNQMSPEEQSQNQLLIYDNMANNEYGWRATFGYRFGAALLDLVFFSIIFVIVLYASGTMKEYQFLFNDIVKNIDSLENFVNDILPLSFIVTFMYYSLEIIMAGTLGKLVMGLQIGDENRKVAGFDKLAIRFAVKHSDSILSLVGFLSVLTIFDDLSGLATVVIIIGFFFVLSDKRQAFHDMVAKTAVFRRQDLIVEEESVIKQKTEL